MDTVAHFYAKDRASWRKWLQENHQQENSVWLVFDKGKDRKLSWQDIVQEALCFGWIDSRPGKVSDTQSKIYVSKRKPKSVWSKINKQHVEALIEKGLMQPAGYEAIETAKRNGSWSALDLSDNLVYPAELVKLFEQNTTARANFEALPDGAKKNALQWVYDAKTDVTRLKRIEQVVEAAARNVRPR